MKLLPKLFLGVLAAELVLGEGGGALQVERTDVAPKWWMWPFTLVSLSASAGLEFDSFIRWLILF